MTSGCSARALSRACATQLNMNGLEIPVEMCASLRTEIGPRAREPALEIAVDDLDHRVAGGEDAQALRGRPDDEHALRGESRGAL